MRWLTGLMVTLLASTFAAASGGRVWVAPFIEIAGAPAPAGDWTARALHQSVTDDLASAHGVTVVTTATTRPSDLDYIVNGTIQRIDADLRVTGRIEEVATGKIVGGFKATGNERDLFAIEDAIAQQITIVVAPWTYTSAVKPTTQPAGVAPGRTFEGSDLQRALEDRDFLRRMQQQYDYQTTPYTYNEPVYPVDYGYGFGLGGGYSYPPYYYGSGYYWGGPWWDGGSIIIINNGHNGRHHFDGGGRHFDGGRRWNGGGGGGGLINPTPLPAVVQNEAVRRASSWAGNPPSVMTHEITPGPQWVPGGNPGGGGRTVGTVGTMGGGGGGRGFGGGGGGGRGGR
jgi:TolB-like protein